MLFKSSHVNTLLYCLGKASAFDTLFAHARLFQKRAEMSIDSERKSLDHALLMPALVLPSGDDAILPMTSLTYFARESRILLVILLRNCL